MIDRPTIERILDAAQIVDVVQQFVPLKKRGVNYLGLCPFHNEKTPSFTVSPSKEIFKCFGCGKVGNSVNFIMERVEQHKLKKHPKGFSAKYNLYKLVYFERFDTIGEAINKREEDQGREPEEETGPD